MIDELLTALDSGRELPTAEEAPFIRSPHVFMLHHHRRWFLVVS
jgi:hypothetical protein